MADIFVYNPNSSDANTAAIDHSLNRHRQLTGHRILCWTNHNGPIGIETDDHVASVVGDVTATISACVADVYVIACFSDPGLSEARRVTTRPVIGIAEAAYFTACVLGKRFGVISILEASVHRHKASLKRIGAYDRLAGDRPIDVSFSDLGGPGVDEKLRAVAETLRDEDGAEVIILGCSNLGGYREALQRTVNLPVIDPVQAAVSQACALVMLDL
jgi:Asp/Glu/hydantoin racemase